MREGSHDAVLGQQSRQRAQEAQRPGGRTVPGTWEEPRGWSGVSERESGHQRTRGRSTGLKRPRRS